MKRFIEEYGKVIILVVAIISLIFVIKPIKGLMGNGIRDNVNSLANGINGKLPEVGGGDSPSYTYEVIAKSESGKQLDSYTVTYGVGTSNLIRPKAIEGYVTPQSQMVTWDSETKTIEFSYDLVKYSLSVDLNGGVSLSGARVPSTYTIESEAIKLPNDLKKGDETFLGYAGSGLTSVKKDVTIPTGSTGNRSYIANYKKAEYVTISFDSRGGGAIESKQITKGGSLQSLPTVSKLGYDFLGWYNGSKQVSVSDTFDTDTQLIAKWKAKHLSRNIIYRSASGIDLKRSTIEYDFGQRVTVKGLDFAGYDKPADHVFTADMNTNDIVIKYTPISYNITYNLNGGGFVNQSGISSYTIESDDITISEATRVGHTFTGWNDNKGTPETKAYTIRKGTTGDIVLTANYNVNTYTLIFDANGGSCNELYRNVAYGQYFTDLPTPTREGYEFAGWYTQSNGETLIDQNDKMGAKDMTVYAKWISYQLVDGPTVNAKLKKINAINSIKSIEFVDIVMPATDITAITGLDADNDGGVVGWYSVDPVDSMAKVYISTQKNGQKVIANKSISHIFSLLRDVEVININNLDTSNVNDMSYSFTYTGENVDTFIVIGLSQWNLNNVTKINDMFRGTGKSATTWNIGNLDNWDTSKVTDMRRMFDSAGSNSVTWSIGDLSGWDVGNVTNISSMFNGAGSNAVTWSIGDLSGWNIGNVTDISGMFSGAGKNATTWSVGDLSGWDLGNVTNISNMFSGAGKNATTWSVGDLSNWNVNGVIYAAGLFANTGSNLTNFEINLSGWNFSRVKNLTGIFNNCNATKIMLPKYINPTANRLSATSKTYYDASDNYKEYSAGQIPYGNSISHTLVDTKPEPTYELVDGRTFNNILRDIDSKHKILSVEFVNTKMPLSGITEINGLDADGDGGIVGWYEIDYNGNASVFVSSQSLNTKIMANPNCSCMFSDKSSTSEGRLAYISLIDVTNLDVSNVVDMSEMFSTGSDADTFEIKGLSNWNTSKVTNMLKMFSSAGFNATTWSIGDLSNWNVGNVTNMAWMFNRAGYNVTTWNIGDLSNWDVSNVTKMYNMFEMSGTNATTWNIGNIAKWNTEKVENMSFMFHRAGINANYKLDLSGWNVSNVTQGSSAFNGGVQNKIIAPKFPL